MTSKKCISMGLKLNQRASQKMEKSLHAAAVAAAAAAACGTNSPSLHHQHHQQQHLPGMPVPPTSSPSSSSFLTTTSSGLNNNNSATSPNANGGAFIPAMNKYGNYDAMNAAAFLAPFQNLQNPFYSAMAQLEARGALNPYSIHRLLSLSNATTQHMDMLSHATTSNSSSTNKTPSLNSDPEDMIEEVTEDEPKLVMDLDHDDEDDDEDDDDDEEDGVDDGDNNIGDIGGDADGEEADDDEEEKKFRPTSSPSTTYGTTTGNNLSTYNSIMESVNKKMLQAHVRSSMESPPPSQTKVSSPTFNERIATPSHEYESVKLEPVPEPQLKCSRCDKIFNHHTELVQHEKVLCGMFHDKHENVAAQMAEALARNVASAAAYHHQSQQLQKHHPQSGSEDDADHMQKTSSSDTERKVRVRTAITEEQQNTLKEHYAINPRPNREEFRTIAISLTLDPRVVQVWFQNNRSRERKMNNVYVKPAAPQLAYASNSRSASPYSPIATPVTIAVPATDDQPLDLSVKKESSSATPSGSPRYGTAPMQRDESDAAVAGSDANEVMNLSSSRKLMLTTPQQQQQQRNIPPAFQHHSSAAQQFYGATVSHLHGEHGEHFVRHTPSPNEAAPRYAPYMLPTSALGLVPMERLLQMTPEMARNPLMNLKTESLSPGSEKRSWKGDESRSSHEDELHALHHQNKRLSSSGAANNNNNHNNNNNNNNNGGGGASGPTENEVEGQFICDQCDKAFSKQSSLARHKYEHSGKCKYFV